MKVLLVNGSPHMEGETYKALKLVEKEIKKKGADVEWFWIGTKPVRGCIDCGKCEEKHRCIFEDDVCVELTNKMLEADGIIIGTPVYYADPNGALCAVLDRVFYSTATKGNLFKGKPVSAVATFARSGATPALDRLTKYFTYSEMIIVTSSYWNLKFADDSLVPNDTKGKNTMRELGRNMVDTINRLKK